MNNETILKHYLVALLWSETNDNSDPLDDDHDLDSVTATMRSKSLEDVNRFIELSAPLFDKHPHNVLEEEIGHDLALTRNGHGAGFWDRGLGVLGDELTALVEKEFKPVHVFVNDSNMLDVE